MFTKPYAILASPMSEKQNNKMNGEETGHKFLKKLGRGGEFMTCFLSHLLASSSILKAIQH